MDKFSKADGNGEEAEFHKEEETKGIVKFGWVKGVLVSSIYLVTVRVQNTCF